MSLHELKTYIARCDGDGTVPCPNSNTLTFHALPDGVNAILAENRWTSSGDLCLSLRCYICTRSKADREAPVGAFDSF